MEEQKLKRIPSGEEALREIDAHERCKTKVIWLTVAVVVLAISLFVVSLGAIKIANKLDSLTKDSKIKIYQIPLEATERNNSKDLSTIKKESDDLIEMQKTLFDGMASFLESQIAHATIIIKPETEVKISNNEIAKVFGFSEAEVNDALGMRRVSNAIVLQDGIDKVDVMIGSPKPQNKETWRVVREGTKIQLVRPNGFIVEPVWAQH